jgi:hypothetical protein
MSRRSRQGSGEPGLPPQRRHLALLAFLSYQIIAIAMTWPLLPGLARDVPGDLGDPLLNLWIIAWGAEQVPRLLTGGIPLQDYWNANIFHPEPLALSFSEHLFGQVLQILPVYHLTGNTILCYNLLFLTSFSLSGLGMFLLVRDVVREDIGEGAWVVPAAFVAGLIYAFVPFRVAQIAHIQSISSQWMPFALYGFRRFIRESGVKALVGGTAALQMQNWSCGYYLIYFAPLVPVFVLHQMWTAGRLRQWRTWLAFGISALAVALLTWPFLALYLEAQRVHGFDRPLGEVMTFSADVYSYFTAPGMLRLWGNTMLALPKPEGELFFGLVPILLALVAIAVQWRSSRDANSSAATVPTSRLRRNVVRVLIAIVTIQAAALVMIVLTGGFVTSVAGIPVRASNATRLATNTVMALAALLLLSPAARRRLMTCLRSPTMLAALFALFAAWMSLGPVPHTRGQLLQVPALYAFFYEHVPGFEGLRVPARYGMVVAVFLSILAGTGAALVMRAARRSALPAAAFSIVFLAETAFTPMLLNSSWGGDFVVPPAHIETAANAPAVYHHIATMPDARVITEFPFGDISWELRFVYYSSVHWKRLVNGYSGTFPASYKTRVALFHNVALHAGEAWQALRATGTTHVIVHESALSAKEAALIEQWLTDHFAVEIARFDQDVLYDIDGVFEHARVQGAFTTAPLEVP